MEILRTPAAARAAVRALPGPIGFVPTMGALHDGHLALVERASAENTAVVASLFVNPLQFGPGEDFERYPRAFERDAQLLAERGVALLYAPSVEAMFPPGFATRIAVGPAGAHFEGAARPGHFDGVATVVAKLLTTLAPTTMYLGQKDVQQTVVLRALVRDLDLPVEVAVVPTVRDNDGLALSSRNVYLSPDQRTAAPSLRRALHAVAVAVAAGETDPLRACAAAEGLLQAPLRWEYLAIVDPLTFASAAAIVRPAIAIGVAVAGTTRLLDNVVIAGADGLDPVVTPERPGRRETALR